MRPDHRGRLAGKFGGSALAARAAGLPRRSAMAHGIAMKTRGPIELIVLDVGLELGAAVADAVDAARDHGGGNDGGDHSRARSAALGAAVPEHGD